jgi:DNA repair photolyase
MTRRYESTHPDPGEVPPPQAADEIDAMPDGLSTGPVRGRGAGLNPANRFERLRLHVLSDHLGTLAVESPEGVQVRTRVLRDRARTIINRVDSPDIPFHWTVNPYRGCEHGCIYCYARPGHEYLGLSSGLDFETTILAKPDAAVLLREALMRPAWEGEPIVLSGVTDPYQPVERALRITRACLEVCAEFRQPVSLITKSHLITRDLDVLAPLAALRAASAAVSITTLRADVAARLEPRASSPRARLDTIRELARAGVPVAVMAAPMIPGLNDHELPAILEAAAAAGATRAGCLLLRLPWRVKDLFLDWLRREFPERAAHVESLIRVTREGALSDPAPFTRHTGVGPYAEQLRATFGVFARRYRLDAPRTPMARTFRRPPPPFAQLDLFVR